MAWAAGRTTKKDRFIRVFSWLAFGGYALALGQQPLDLGQFPCAEKTDRVSAKTLPVVEFTHAAIGAVAALTVAHMDAVDVEGQAPAFDIDLNLAGPGVFIEAPQRVDAQGGIAQCLVNLAGGQG